MLNQPDKEIKLSDEQKLAIEKTQSRLSILETEISIATKNLKVIKGDIEKAVKENSYLEDTKVSLTTEVETLKANKEKLETAVKEANEHLAKIKEEDLFMKAEQSKVLSDQSERENKLREEEKNLENSKVAHREENEKLTAEKERITKFVGELSAVIKTW